MALSFDYVARETATNLWRNRLMTAAAILTAAIALGAVGVSLLLRQGVNSATQRWRGGVSLSIFMNPTSTTSQINAIGAELKVDPQVKSSYFLNHEQSYAEMKRLFPNEPDLVGAVTPSDLPPSFRVVLRDAGQATAVGDEFKNQAGVKEVQSPAVEVTRMLHVTDVLQAIFFGVAVILGISALVLILTTIRMAIFARRREVQVMKLVGATNWFIRIPFMLEGFVQGLLGAFVACCGIEAANWTVKQLVAHDQARILQPLPGSPREVAYTMVVVLILGAAVGVISSFIAVRRFLEV